MPLSKTIIPLNLIQTLEQSVADNVSQQPLVVENLICDKLGQLQKRWGYDVLGNSIMGQGTQLPSPRYLAERRGELLAFTEEGAYKYAASADQMIQVSGAILTEVSKVSVIRNNYNQSYAQMAVANNVVVTVYRDSRGGCRYSALDETSQTLLKNDVSLGNITNPTFLTFGAKLLLFYVKDSDSTICFRTIDLESFGLLAEVLVEGVTAGTNKLFRVKTYSVSKFSLAYVTSGGKLSLGFYGIDGQEASARDAVSDRFEVTSSFTKNFDYVIEQSDQIYHRIVWATATDIVLQVYKEDGSAQAASVVLSAYTDMHAMTVSFDDDLFVAWDKTDTTPQEYVIYGGKWTLAGVPVTAPYIIGAGLSLISEVFMIGTSRYMLTNYTSVFQPNNFVVSELGSVAAKFNKDSALQHRTTVGNLVAPVLDSETWRFAIDTRTKLSREDDYYSQNYGISVFTMDYSAISPTAATLDRTLYVTGSVLRSYDGATFAEAGFLLSPDGSVMSATSTAAKASGFISSTGKITFTAFAYGTGGNSISVAFTTGATAGSEVVSVVGNAVSVQIQSGVSTAAQIVTKIEASAAAMALITPVVTTGGAMAAPATVTLTGGAGGSLSAGTYQYKAIYSWMDNFGDIHRSGESEAVTVSAVLNGAFSVSVPTLYATDKSVVLIEIYRTLVNGTEFHLSSTVVNDKTQTYTVVTDTTSDTTLASAETLYTNGGVLSNNSFTTCTAVTVNDNRIIVGGVEGSDSVFYTKEKLSGLGVGPSDFLSLNTGAKGGAIVALKGFGDVTVVLKETCIGVISGQFATDTGLLVSLKYDTISEEVGCFSHASLIEIDKGVIFQSQRGLCLVGKDLSVTFIGAPVEGMRDYPITSACLLSGIQTVIFTTEDKSAICMNYGKNAWSTFTGHEAISAVTSGTDYYMLTTDGRVLKRNTSSKTDGGFGIVTRLKTQWYQLGGIGGFERIYSLVMQGMLVGAHGLRVSMYYDFEESARESLLYVSGQLATYGETGTFGTVIVDQTKPLQQIRVQPRWQKCTSVSVELAEWVPDGYEPDANIVWNGIRFEIGVKRGAYKFDSSKAAVALLGG